MSKKTKIILAAVLAVILIVAISVAAIIFKINRESSMTFKVHKAIEERDAVTLSEYVAEFDRNERNIELENVVYNFVEKAYKSENYEDILFCEVLSKELTTQAKYYSKGMRPFMKDIKKIPHEYSYAKNKAYMKGYWVRVDGSPYQNTVVIVAGNNEDSLTASIRTVGPNYEGYKEGDPLWSNVVFGDGFRFNAGVLTRTKDVYFAYRPASGVLNIDKGTLTVSVEGEIQNWRKAEYDEIKEMTYDYRAYKGSKWISKDNSDVTLEIKDTSDNSISFEVYNEKEDVRLIISNLALEGGVAEFEKGDGTLISGTIRINGAKVQLTFDDDAYTSGDYILQ